MPAQVEPTVRDLINDEEFLIFTYERHSVQCPQCHDPLKTLANGGILCDRGNRFAVDLHSYVFSVDGKARSLINRRPTLVDLPVGCDAVRRLLLAVERGLALRPVKGENPIKGADHLEARKPTTIVTTAPPVISYDKTHPVPPRVITPEPYDDNEIIDRVPYTSKPRRSATVYPSSPSSSSTRTSSTSRGSLYDGDSTGSWAGTDRRGLSPRGLSPRGQPIDYHR